MASSIHILINLLPVIIFLGVLILLDSFKLVKKTYIFLCLLWGMCCVIIAYFLNRWLIYLDIFEQWDFTTKLIPPLTEEFLKISIILLLLIKNRIGFMVDGAIYGFAVGTGFALLENTYYFSMLDSGSTMLWLVRGFGTAIMHGGTAAIFTVILMSAINRNRNTSVYVIIGYLIAVLVHYFYNWLSFSAQLATLSVIISIPAFMMIIFILNEKSIRKWVDLEMDKEVELLLMIRQGHFAETKAGKYVITLKKHFQPLIMVDILSYIYIYLELATKAKANLILRENDMPVNKIPDIDEQLKELSILKKNIGKTGMIAIRPILRMNNKDLWNLSMLK